MERRRLVLASALILSLGLSLIVLSIWNPWYDGDYLEISISDLWANWRDLLGKTVRTRGIVKYYPNPYTTDTVVGDFYILPITSKYISDTFSRPPLSSIPVLSRNGQPLPADGSYVEVYGKFDGFHMAGGIGIYIDVTSWHYTSVAYDFINVIMLFFGVALVFVPFYILGKLLGWRRILRKERESVEFPSGD